MAPLNEPLTYTAVAKFVGLNGMGVTSETRCGAGITGMRRLTHWPIVPRSVGFARRSKQIARRDFGRHELFRLEGIRLVGLILEVLGINAVVPVVAEVCGRGPDANCGVRGGY
jgi:hypothetical protein